MCSGDQGPSVLPVIMLTAKGDDIDRIIGLESGGRLHSKPCSPRELSRGFGPCFAHAARPTAVQPAAIRAGAIVMDPQRRQVECAADGRLTSTEFNVLEVLARHPGDAGQQKTSSPKRGLGRPIARFDRDRCACEQHRQRSPVPSGQPRILTVRALVTNWCLSDQARRRLFWKSFLLIAFVQICSDQAVHQWITITTRAHPSWRCLANGRPNQKQVVRSAAQAFVIPEMITWWPVWPAPRCWHGCYRNRSAICARRSPMRRAGTSISGSPSNGIRQ